MELVTILVAWVREELNITDSRLKACSIFLNRNLTLRHRINSATLGCPDNSTTYPSPLVHRMANPYMKIALQLVIRHTTVQEVTTTAKTEITEKYSNLRSATMQRTQLISTR
jgi:hypothetical protein